MATREKRILVVEDDGAIRALLLTILRRRGFRVDTAANGADALAKLHHCAYSLILLDLMMPVMSGYEFLGHMEQLNLAPSPLVIVLTAGGVAHKLNPEIVSGTVRKPFDIELLADTVTACLSTVADVTQVDNCPTAESDSSPNGARNQTN